MKTKPGWLEIVKRSDNYLMGFNYGLDDDEVTSHTNTLTPTLAHEASEQSSEV